VTTPAYASRLRERRDLELTLADDARKRAWPREVERHCGIARRIEQLLGELGGAVESCKEEGARGPVLTPVDVPLVCCTPDRMSFP